MGFNNSLPPMMFPEYLVARLHPDCDHQDPLNWDPGKLLESMGDRLEHKTLET